MAGLVPANHSRDQSQGLWIAGTSPAMTNLDCEPFQSNPPYTPLFTIICLISPIAWAGLRPFGQALAQFMMVWQR